METLNLALGIIGVILGLISAKSTFSEWLSSGKSWLSQQAQKVAEKRKLRQILALQDPGYLIALISRDLLIAFGFIVILLAVNSLPPKNEESQLILQVIRAFLIIPVSFLLGYRTGFCARLLHEKERLLKLAANKSSQPTR